MTLAQLTLRTVLVGQPRAWTAVLALAAAAGALARTTGPTLALDKEDLLLLAIIACIVAATTSLHTFARRRELATLRALGMPKSALVLMLELEALWISICGILLGLGGGAMLAWCAGHLGGPWQTLPKEGAALRMAEAGSTLAGLAAVLAAVLTVTVLAALVPAIRAAHRAVAPGLALIPARQEG